MNTHRFFAVAVLLACAVACFAEIPLLESEQTVALSPRHTQVTFRASAKKCAVYLNGEYQGNTPLSIRDLPQGLYHLRVAKHGYADADYMVSVTDGRHEHYYVALSKAPAADDAATAGNNSATGE